MIISFLTRDLRTVCEDERVSADQLGNEIGQQLVNRLADLRAASSINDIVVGLSTLIDADGARRITLPPNGTLKFRANHPNNPIDVSGNVDWKRVSRIMIMEIDIVEA